MENKSEVRTNENGGKEYVLNADVGYPLGTPQSSIDMNDIMKLAEKNGFVRTPIKLAVGSGMMVPCWQKDVLDIKFWDAITKAIEWDKDTAMTTGMRFVELCFVSNWDNGVEYLANLIKKSTKDGTLN